MGAQGLIGIQTPSEVGGHGGDFLTHIITCEEQGYAAVPGNFLIQSDMVSKSKHQAQTPAGTFLCSRAPSSEHKFGNHFKIWFYLTFLSMEHKTNSINL